MKKLMLLLCGLVTLLGIASATGVATATPASTQACTVQNLATATLTYQGELPPRVGEVHLQKDGCGHYRAHVKLDHTLNSNEYAQGWISRWENGVRKEIYNCDQGGNGRIVANQTSCLTKWITSPNSSSLFIASAHYYWRSSASSAWFDDSWGQTPGRR